MDIEVRRICLALCCITIALVATPATAAILWVGDNTPACQAAPNHHTTIFAAVLAARLSASNDEIRITNTQSYVGNGSAVDYADFHPGVNGSLVIAGGYADCNSSQSGRTLFGGNAGFTFTIETIMEPTSVVTLRNIEISGAVGGAVFATGGAEVTLDNVWIHDNNSGVGVFDGAFMDIEADTLIENNITGGAWGGGLVCTGVDTLVNVAGFLFNNQAPGGNGGNIYLSSGCFVELLPGARVEGNSLTFQADNGGGIYVDNGGELLSNGGANRISISSNSAQNGGGLFLNGTGKATLLNTRFKDNFGGTHGSAIYANNGGLVSAQLTMDRVMPCPFIISCSEIEDSVFGQSVVYASNSLIRIQRTIIERADSFSTQQNGIVFAENNAIVRLNAVKIDHNDVKNILYALSGAEFEVTHVTMANNSSVFPGSPDLQDSFIGLNTGFMNIQNSIMIDTRGMDNRGGFVSGKCNLVNDGTDLPAGSFFVDTPSFFDAAGGDYRQNANSPGVDACLQDTFAWSTERDLGYQIRPVNEGTNPSGMPGETGGKYDAGYFESYINPADDFFDLTVTLAGDGNGAVQSINVVGITCEPDCQETYDQGIIVELLGTAAPGSELSWSGCDVSGGVLCAVTMNSNKNVTATFSAPPPGYIFGSGFE